MSGPPGETPGARLVRADVVATGAFVVTAVGAALWPEGLAPLAVAVDGILFLAGCAAFVWSLARVAARSGSEEVSVPAVYLLAGSAPGSVRRTLLGALSVQVVVALATAAARPFTPLAFGVLVPVLGLGVCGLWATSHGSFPPRRREGAG